MSRAVLIEIVKIEVLVELFAARGLIPVIAERVLSRARAVEPLNRKEEKALQEVWVEQGGQDRGEHVVAQYLVVQITHLALRFVGQTHLKVAGLRRVLLDVLVCQSGEDSPAETAARNAADAEDVMRESRVFVLQL